MKRLLSLTVAAAFFACSLGHAMTAKGNSKIQKCIKAKDCKFMVTAAATDDPRMSFVVKARTWKTFTILDKNDLKVMLKIRIADAKAKPEKYISVSKKASSYEKVRRNVENMQSYSVFLSYGSKNGNLQLDEEILVNY